MCDAPEVVSKLVAFPSTQRVGLRKVPLAVTGTSIPTATLPTETTALFLDCSLIMEDVIRKKPNHLPGKIASCEVGEFVSRAMCRILFKYRRRNAMEWRSWRRELFDIVITVASMTRIPLLDCENLDFKIASDLRRVHVGNFRKQVTTAEGKAQMERRSLTGRQTSWMAQDFIKHWRRHTEGHQDSMFDSENFQHCSLWWRFDCSVLGCDHGGKSRAMRAVVRALHDFDGWQTNELVDKERISVKVQFEWRNLVDGFCA